MTFLDGFASGFLPAFQNSGQGFLANRRADKRARLENDLLRQRIAAGGQAQDFAREDREAAANQSAMEQARIAAQIGDLVEAGKLSTDQADIITAAGAPKEQLAQAIDISGLLAKPPSERELAELAKVQAETDLKRAQTEDLGKPDAVKPTALMQNLAAAGIDPDSDQGRKIITDTLTGAAQGRDAAKLAAEKERAVSEVKRGSKRQESLVESADAARSSLDTIARMKELSGSIATGPGSDLRTEATKIADFFGAGGLLQGAENLTGADLRVDDVAATEEFEGLRAELDLQARALQKGPQTDQDASVIAKTTPQASDDAETIQRKLAQREALTTIILNRSELEARLIDQGVPALDARKQAIEAIPSPREASGAGSFKTSSGLSYEVID